MKHRAIATFLVFIIVVGYAIVGWSVSPTGRMEDTAQRLDFACVSDVAATWTLASVMFAAATSPKANRCLEDCSKARQQCEQGDKHRPGSKENIEWSMQCQGNYIQCMNGCR